MPIYVYKCSACHHEQDVLQKMSDPLLTVCPECGQSTYQKQLTAAGFQLKGTGWYVTDFRDKGSKDSDKAPPARPHAASDSTGPAPSPSAATSSDSGSAAPTTAAAPASTAAT